MFFREGRSGKTIKPGDRITVTGHPARNAPNGIRIEQVILPHGRELSIEGPCGTQTRLIGTATGEARYAATNTAMLII
jgi:hypothetical protein